MEKTVFVGECIWFPPSCFLVVFCEIFKQRGENFKIEDKATKRYYKMQCDDKI